MTCEEEPVTPDLATLDPFALAIVRVLLRVAVKAEVLRVKYVASGKVLEPLGRVGSRLLLKCAQLLGWYVRREELQKRQAQAAREGTAVTESLRVLARTHAEPLLDFELAEEDEPAAVYRK